MIWQELSSSSSCVSLQLVYPRPISYARACMRQGGGRKGKRYEHCWMWVGERASRGRTLEGRGKHKALCIKTEPHCTQLQVQSPQVLCASDMHSVVHNGACLARRTAQGAPTQGSPAPCLTLTLVCTSWDITKGSRMLWAGNAIIFHVTQMPSGFTARNSDVEAPRSVKSV